LVQLWFDRERLDRENVTKAKMCLDYAAATIICSRVGSKRSEHAEKKFIGAKKVPVIVLSDWENEEEHMVGGNGWDDKC